MKTIYVSILMLLISNSFAASWERKSVEETIYSTLQNDFELRTYFMKNKKSSEWYVNSLKQLTYRTYWHLNVVQGSVAIQEIETEDLEFILNREFSEITFSDLKKISKFNEIVFHLGEHETENEYCIDLIMFEFTTKEAAIYSECSEL